MDSKILMEDNKKNFPQFLYDKVLKAADQAAGNGFEYFNEIVGVLKVASERKEFEE